MADLHAQAEKAVQREETFRQKHFAVYRFAEILPGVLVWLTLIGGATLALVRPLWAAAIILIYVVAFLLRTGRFTYYLLKAYPMFTRSIKVKWREKLEADPALLARSNELTHVILAATYKEEAETVARGLRLLTESTFPLNQVIYVLCIEARDHDHATEVASSLKQEFGHYFKDFLISEHPADIPGEVKGKGSNISWAGREFVAYCRRHKLDSHKVLVTSIDSDHRLHREYLSALTYSFLEEKDPDKIGFVSVALFFNNVWDVPSPVRFIHFSSSFWMMVTSVWITRLQNVMTQTQTLWALEKTDFYSPISVVEDGHQYWRSIFALGNEYSVKMVLMPVYSDAVLTSTFWGTLREQYLQRRRWHFGISDFPYVFTHFIYEKRVRSTRTFLDMWRLFDGHYNLATSSILLGVIGWIPIWLSPSFRTSVLGLNFASFYGLSLRLALVGTGVLIIFAILLAPPKYKDRPASRLYIILDYIILPVQIVFYIILASSVPSIDAQTRLMLGKYLGFRVTTKAVSTRTDLST